MFFSFRGLTFFLVCLYIFVFLLLMTAALCVWVAYSVRLVGLAKRCFAQGLHQLVQVNELAAVAKVQHLVLPVLVAWHGHHGSPCTDCLFAICSAEAISLITCGKGSSRGLRRREGVVRSDGQIPHANLKTHLAFHARAHMPITFLRWFSNLFFQVRTTSCRVRSSQPGSCNAGIQQRTSPMAPV